MDPVRSCIIPRVEGVKGFFRFVARRYGGVAEPSWFAPLERALFPAWVLLWILPVLPADFLWLKPVGDWMLAHRSLTPPHDLLSPYALPQDVPNLPPYAALIVALWSRVVPGLAGVAVLHIGLATLTGLVWRGVLGRWAWVLWPLYAGMFHARPQVFTGLLFPLFLVLLDRPPGWRRRLLLFFLLGLWLPLHGGGALVALGLWGLRGVLERRPGDVLAAAVVPFLHPWGGVVFLKGLLAFLGRPLRWMIIEWQPPWFFLVEPTNTGLLVIGGLTALAGLLLWPLLRNSRRFEGLVLSLATWSAVRYMIFTGPYFVWNLRPPLAWWLLLPFFVLAPLGVLRLGDPLAEDRFPPRPGPETGVVVGPSPEVDAYLFFRAPRVRAAVYANWDRFDPVHLRLYQDLLSGTHCAYWRARADYAVMRRSSPGLRCFRGWTVVSSAGAWVVLRRPP